ncbi:hypothetical protein, partial [Xanthomonas oryzae]
MPAHSGRTDARAPASFRQCRHDVECGDFFFHLQQLVGARGRRISCHRDGKLGRLTAARTMAV